MGRPAWGEKVLKVERPPSFIWVMNSASNLSSIIPPAARVPSDYVILLTYTSKQTEAQRQRVNVSVAREHGVDLDCATDCDELV
jgi:hypothetical protein